MGIREVRRQAGVSQAELARRVGLDQSGVSRLERGKRPVTLPTLRAVARALGVPVTALLDDDDRAPE